ncbi:cupin domain-containing protein [Alkalisalibacterium limincola]|uniref:DUF4437 domain-containing protein n=1 Tax=Alkalisalibacterium limincola TaxID=2699169 RepID=A0A5C8L0D8_9GAMM|nr:cupin domain-containing protein [Alkalisalibacterium limincola]TXK65705.1 DUF4437 domain-containing protein [Alkalisalibacterium limincola]
MITRTQFVVGSAFLVASLGCHAEQAPPSPQVEPAAQAQAHEAHEAPEAPEAPAQPEGRALSMRDLDRGPGRHLNVPADAIEWADGPGSLDEGARFAVLEGDPARDGIFTLQLKLPDGFLINPHWHPNVERVTVLRGTFRLGSGDTVDKDATIALPAGSYTAMPPEMVHFAIAEGETVVQLTSVGPWVINYVDPEHDPRN